MNPKVIKIILGVLILGFVISAPLKAQVSGATVTGTVTDPSGGVIASAQIAAKNVATSVVSSTTTNSDGFYNLPNLLPGEYQVKVTAPGFTTKVASITLTVGAKRSLDVGIDRKSTRLNSSHGYISYAVFCLKKKQKIQRQRLEVTAVVGLVERDQHRGDPGLGGERQARAAGSQPAAAGHGAQHGAERTWMDI